jgi:hypothetical protein
MYQVFLHNSLRRLLTSIINPRHYHGTGEAIISACIVCTHNCFKASSFSLWYITSLLSKLSEQPDVGTSVLFVLMSAVDELCSCH